MAKDRVRVPEDFVLALKADDYIYEFFLTFPPSHKRGYVDWIEEAKKPDTRARRVRETVAKIREKHQKGSYNA